MVSRIEAAAVTLLACAWLVVGSARAQDVGDSSAPELFRRGVTAFEEQRFDAALDAFRRSYATRPDPGLLYNIALTEAHVALYADAYRDFTRYLSEAATIDESRRAAVQAALDDLATRIALVSLDVEPADAAVSIDGGAIEGAARSAPVPVAPGSHVIDAVAERRSPGRARESFAPGERRTVRLVLEPAPGTLVVTLEPANSVVHVDGRLLAGGRVRTVDRLRPGRHRLDVTARDMRPERRDVELEPGGTTAVAIVLRSSIGLPVLTVTSSPVRAFVRIDAAGIVRSLDDSAAAARRIVQTPWTGEVAAGDVVLRFEADGRHAVVMRRRFLGGRRYRVGATLRRDLGWLESPLFWIASGTLVTGGVVAGVVAATSQPDTRFDLPTTSFVE